MRYTNIKVNSEGYLFKPCFLYANSWNSEKYAGEKIMKKTKIFVERWGVIALIVIVCNKETQKDLISDSTIVDSICRCVVMLEAKAEW
jgi:hypothetical protein